MSKGLQTFVSYKYLKDAAGIQYLALVSHGSNPVVGAKSTSKSLVLSLKSSVALKDGNVEQVYSYIGSGTIEIAFKEGQSESITIVDLPKGAELAVPFDSLIRSFTFDVSSESLLGYDISDALYYGEGTSRYKETYIVPQSKNPHLDTSSREDFYYLTDGTTAYIASTSLQNKFLNDIKYSNRGSDAADLGKFRGKLDDGSELSFATTPENPTSGSIGPTVVGGMIALSLVSREGPAGNERILNRVCLDPEATNYYLTGCVGEALPCVDSGTTHANDCFGVALTADRINTNINVDGQCCAYPTGCEDFSVVITSITDADVDVANGTINVTVSDGVQNYTAIVEAIELENPENSFSTQTTSSIATDEFTLSSLFPGEYQLTVTDSTSGIACARRMEFIVPSQGRRPDGEGDFGCKDTSTAINHDSSATTHQDSLCVFCDADSGLLFADSTNPVYLGNAFDLVEGEVPISHATSTPEGVTLNNASFTFLGVELSEDTHILSPEPQLHDFVAAEEFTTDQANMFDYQLYKVDSGTMDLAAEIEAGPAGNAKAWLTANATATGSVVQSDGGAHTYTDLEHGSYAVLVSYDSDGTPNNDPDEEKCYRVYFIAMLGQIGCTDPEALNYNTAHQSEPTTFVNQRRGNRSLCRYRDRDDTVSCDPGIVFEPSLECFGDYGIKFNTTALGETNPNIEDAAVNGFTVTQNNIPAFPPIVAGDFLDSGSYNFNLTRYTFYELFCFDTYNSNTDNSLMIVGLPQSPAGGGTWSNGYPPPPNGTGMGLHVVRVNNVITLADGTEILGSAQGTSLWNWRQSDYQINIATCSHIQTHGLPVSMSFKMNWGEYGVWDQVYEYTYYFTQDDHDEMNACCNIEEPEVIPGCTDPAAENYNPAATVDDGTCEYPEPPEIPGCTDPTAINYNPAATVDDGSCRYIQPGSWEPLDCHACTYNEDNQTGFATQAECEASIEQNSDCCIIEGSLIGEDGILTFTTTQSDSSFNSETGLCDDQSTGQLVVTLPDLTDLVANTGCVTYWWKIEHAGNGQYYSNLWGGTAVDGVTADGFYSGMDTSDLITPTGGVGQDTITVTDLPYGVYNVYVYFMDTCFDSNEIQIQDPFGFCRILVTTVTLGLQDCDDDIIHGCTDPEAVNYLLNCENVSVPNANVDDGCCVYLPPPPPPRGCDCGNGTYSERCCPPDPVCGCPDPNASNYNPNATYYDPSADGCGCEYDGDPPYIGDPPEVTTVLACVPRVIDKLIAYNNECIARSGHRFYTKHITGLGNSCSTMETMKMVIINDLMNRKGLPCIFNCSDNDTPEPDTASNDCRQNWIDSGSLFWNPANAAAGLFNLGVHVRRPFTPNPQGLAAPIYVAISNSGLDIDPFSNDSASGWKLCKTASIVNEKNNYLPNFLKFAHEYCKDCGILPYRTSDISRSSVTDTFATGGSEVTQGGASFENTSDQSGLTDESNGSDSSGPPTPGPITSY